ncbi:peptidylprolyl isomerase [Malassezia sp. CBS 17886]|nr:peptidylprolyl isomerase [Malassezia sp. CBS 17886]
MSTLYVTEPPTDGKVILHTSKGEVEIELWAKEAPKACRNIIALALEGYYDAGIWHRIVPGFCVQTGDPTGTGRGGESVYGEPFADEVHQRLRFNRRGMVAMANAGRRNTNDSQFFITLDATPELQNKHTIFGRVAGPTIYNALALAEVELSDTEPDRPVFPPKLLRVEVVHNPFLDIVPRITREEREAQQAARRRIAQQQVVPEHDRKKQKKNTALLSFGGEEDLPSAGGARVPLSSHDLLNDKKLSRKTAERTRARGAGGERDAAGDAGRSMRSASPAPAEERPVRDASPRDARPSQPPAPAAASEQAALEDAVRRGARGILPTASTPGPKGRTHLAELAAEYRKGPGASRRNRERDTLAMLGQFRSSVQRKEGAESRSAPGRDPYGDADGREYGASDDEYDAAAGSDWRSHRFDAGGVPLLGGKDKFSVHDYEVVDSRNTQSDVALSLGFGGHTAVHAHSKREREEAMRREGRRGRDWQ